MSESGRAEERRKTRETEVRVAFTPYGEGTFSGRTGLGFLDHMLAAFAQHGLFDLEVECTGDLHIDEHHSVEDTAITLGLAFAKATGDRAGIVRMGHAYVPMDEALVRAAVDLSGRPWLGWAVPVLRERVGDLPVELAEHFWHSFAQHAGVTLHVDCVRGRNQHHVLEATWKACARALAAALAPRARGAGVMSTKGVLGERAGGGA